MRPIAILLAAISTPLLGLAATAAPQQLATPLYFEPNQGQFPAEVRFAARGPKYTAWITDQEIRIAAGKAAKPAAIAFAAASAKPRLAQGLDRLPGISNYMQGNDPAKWIHGVPSFAKAKIEEIYPGIDILFYARNGGQELEYDLIVKPGADPAQISIHFDARLQPRKGLDGEITMQAAGGVLRHQIPLVHQSGKAVGYQTRFDGSTLRFDIAKFDRKQALVIDPTIVYLTTAGDNGEAPKGIAVDSTGAAYITGTTLSTFAASTDIFVTKIGGTPVSGVYPRIYTLHFGGANEDSATSIAVDSAGAAYIAGRTGSVDFPVKAPFQPANGGNFDGFVLKIAAASPYDMVYSSYIGGSGAEIANSIAVGADGAAYIAGQTRSPNFPVLNAFQSTRTGSDLLSAFVVKIAANPIAQGTLYPRVYATLLGGSGTWASGIAVDSTGAAYVAGATFGVNFPSKNAYQQASGGDVDAFAAKISGAATQSTGVYDLVYATMLGGSGRDEANAVAVDAAGAAIVVGKTYSGDYPIFNALQPGRPAPPPNIFGASGFVTRINSQANPGCSTNFNLYPCGVFAVNYSSYFGGGADMSINGVALDPSSSAVHIAGTVSPVGGFPAVDSWFGPSTNENAAPSGFTAKMLIPATGTASLVYSTKLLTSFDFSAIAVDSTGSAYLAGVMAGRTLASVAGADVVPGDFGAPFAMKLSPTVSTPSVTLRFESGDPLTPMKITVSGPAACNPGDYDSPASFFWPTGAVCFVSVPQSAIGNSIQNVFTKWEDNSVLTTRTISVGSSPATYSATYRVNYALILNVVGQGTLTPGNGGYYAPGTVVPLTATPANGWLFQAWGPGVANRASAQTSITISRNGNFAGATFVEALPSSFSPSQFVPVSPCRIVDTRAPGINVIAPGTIAAKATRDFVIGGASVCGIPANATAFSLNVTAVPKGTLGYLTAYPAGQSQPTVSTLNSLDGRVKANAAIVPAGTGGKISVYATDETDLVLDINGYFVAPQTGSLQYYPITPCRAVDTRSPSGGGILAATTIRTVPISTPCGIPANARAYAMNATVVPSAALGFLRIQPAGATPVATSTLNAVTGTIVANAAIIPAGTNGAVDVYATEATHLVLDINGYFAPPGDAGLNFYAISPCRSLDSRDGTGNPFAAKTPFGMAGTTGNCSVPAAARVLSLNATVIPQTPSFGYLTLWPADFSSATTPPTPPLASTLNAVDGAITSNAAFVELLGGIFGGYASDRVHLVVDVNGFFAK